MIRLWLSFLVLCFSLQVFGQNKVSGTVKSSVDKKPLTDITVRITENGKSVKTDRIGYFQFGDIGNGSFTIAINSTGYEGYTENFTVSDGNVDLGEIYLQFNPKSSMAGIITLTADELESEEESGAQSSVGLLQSSQDVFAQVAAYDLGGYWFRTRGYDNKYSDVLFNGVRMNKINNGRVDYGNWGGLNDVTRNPEEVIYGVDPSDYAFGTLGGSMYIDTRPSTKRAGTSLSYSLTNRSYRQRLMLSHNTGLNKDGWGFMVSGSRRWAEEGRVPGTFYDAWGYFLGAEKKFNEQHTLNLTVFGAPNRRSTNSPNTQEIYDLMGTDYNAYWGYQNGEKRSERVKKSHEPIAMLTHHWNIDENTKLITTAAYQFGEKSGSRLDWYEANNPTPIYYRRFPSYAIGQEMSEDYINVLKDAWRNDTSFSQINWAQLYQANRNQADGHAVYYLVSDVNEDKTLSLSSTLRTRIANKINLYAGFNYQNAKSDTYRRLDDLLGGKFVIDKDDFADSGLSGDSDTRHPDRKVYEGGKLQYNATYNYEFAEAWASGQFNINQLDVRLGLNVSNTSMERNGLYDYYNYDNSYGKSGKRYFGDYGAKLQLLYKIDGRNFIKINGGYFTKAPTINDVFPQGRLNNLSIPNLESTKIKTADINYILRAPRVKARATAFYTRTDDEVDSSFGYLDFSNNRNLFTAEVMSGVAKQYIGTELAVEVQLTTTLTANAAASIGQYTYANNPDLYYFTDNFRDTQFEDLGGYTYVGTSYIKDYKLASSPQKGYSLGIEYRSPKYWWIGVTGNYLADNYVDISPTKRTAYFAQGAPNLTEDALRQSLRQEKFSNEFMMNLNLGKSFRIGQYWAMLGLTVNNLLNNKDYRTSGFEQSRLANYNIENTKNNKQVFGNRYWYDQGTSYFLNLIVRF